MSAELHDKEFIRACDWLNKLEGYIEIEKDTYYTREEIIKMAEGEVMSWLIYRWQK
jgi:hypothetical protein